MKAAFKSCAAPGCDKPAGANYARWCGMHKARLARHGSLDARLYDVNPPTCAVDGCEKKATSKRMCGMHHTRRVRHGDPSVRKEPRRGRAECSVDGCAVVSQARGLCKTHWAAWDRTQRPEWYRAKGRRDAANRRARLAAAPTIPFSVDQLAARMSMWGDRCWMCGATATAADHVKPLARGGSHCLANLRPACKPCNSAKKDRWPL